MNLAADVILLGEKALIARDTLGYPSTALTLRVDFRDFNWRKRRWNRHSRTSRPKRGARRVR